MVTMLVEESSVARGIARIVGAVEGGEGYFTESDYHVVRALGHLIQLALPDSYGIKGFRHDGLLVIPRNFEPIPRQVEADKDYKADTTTVGQIEVITKLWNESDGIIMATDCAHEGKLVSRYLYSYVGCTLPFQRLWVSSLTNAAIRRELRKLKDGRGYDDLCQAAEACSEADWLIGINGTQVLPVAAGRDAYSMGWVQTPTLTMVCQRFWENKCFQPRPVYQLRFTMPSVSADKVMKFASVEKWEDKGGTITLYNKVKRQMAAIVTKAEKKEKVENSPLLYDLVTLQKKASTGHGFTTKQTLVLVQKLYEAKLVVYPRTSSRYAPEDVLDEMPMLFDRLATRSSFVEKIGALDGLNHHSADASRMTDHHAPLAAPNRPLALHKDEQTTYDMIVGRMVGALSPECVKDATTVRAGCGGIASEIKGCIMRKTGWRSIYGEDNIDIVLPD